jgi:hypothetical protein
MVASDYVPIFFKNRLHLPLPRDVFGQAISASPRTAATRCGCVDRRQQG